MRKVDCRDYQKIQVEQVKRYQRKFMKELLSNLKIERPLNTLHSTQCTTVHMRKVDCRDYLVV